MYTCSGAIEGTPKKKAEKREKMRIRFGRQDCESGGNPVLSLVDSPKLDGLPPRVLHSGLRHFLKQGVTVLGAKFGDVRCPTRGRGGYAFRDRT